MSDWIWDRDGLLNLATGASISVISLQVPAVEVDVEHHAGNIIRTLFTGTPKHAQAFLADLAKSLEVLML